MPIRSLGELYEAADSARPGFPIAVAGGADRTVLEALRMASDRGWIRPLVLGRVSDMRELGDNCRIGLDGFVLIEAEEPAPTAVELVRSGGAALLMKGQVPTPVLMRAVLDPVAGLRTGRVICQVVLIEIRPASRRLVLADTGICIQPTLEQKCDILQSAVAVAQRLGAELPRVAVLAASETVSEAMPETLDARELQRRNEVGSITGCLVQGPLSFDLAYATDAAEKKHAVGAVAGAADVLIFPNLLSANLTVKAITYTADCSFGGVLCGAACPVVFMSRADTTTTRLNSLALAVQLAGAAWP